MNGYELYGYIGYFWSGIRDGGNPYSFNGIGDFPPSGFSSGALPDCCRFRDETRRSSSASLVLDDGSSMAIGSSDFLSAGSSL